VTTWLSDRALEHLRDVAAQADPESPRYTLLDEIGRGGMGVVYRARDEMLERDVAVKVIGGSLADPDLAARLRREAHVLASLEHPGIVPVHDAGRLPDGRAFYVMKLVRGASLVDHVAGVDRLDERLGVFERICEAVAFAHASGVVHRDIKPANVMVGSFGEVLVLDWGLALAVGDQGDPGAQASGQGYPGAEAPGPRVREWIAGTPGFMAPEQARGEIVGRAADVHALGALLVWMLAGQTPEGPSERVAALLRERGTPVRLRAVALKAMASEASERYRDAAALGADIARWRAGLPVSAHRETTFERIARFVSTYRTPILLVLAYLVMRILVAVYVRMSRS
jgi:eukaryotic-like serine/threonine-protein kinase